MDCIHPQLVIEIATAMHRERLASALVAYNTAIPVSRGGSPRAALATALVALAGRLSPDSLARRGDVAV